MRETWWIAPDARHALLERAPCSIAAWMHHAANGTYLSSDRRSMTRFIGDPVLLVKWRLPRQRHVPRDAMRASRARREARLALSLRAVGIPTPRPWAAAELRRGVHLVASLLVREFQSELVPAKGALETGFITSRDLILALRSWHRAGFRHGDAYPKNMLVNPIDRLVLPIGFPAAKVIAQKENPTDRAAAKDMAQLLVGCALQDVDIVSLAHMPAMQEMLFAALASDAPADLLWARTKPRIASILRKKETRRITRPLREPEGPPRPTPLPWPSPTAPRTTTRALV